MLRRLRAGRGPAKQVKAAIDKLLDDALPGGRGQDQRGVHRPAGGQIDQVLYLIYALLAMAIIVSLFGIVNTLVLLDLRAHARARAAAGGRHVAAPGPADDPLRGDHHRADRRRDRARARGSCSSILVTRAIDDFQLSIPIPHADPAARSPRPSPASSRRSCRRAAPRASTSSSRWPTSRPTSAHPSSGAAAHAAAPAVVLEAKPPQRTLLPLPPRHIGSRASAAVAAPTRLPRRMAGRVEVPRLRPLRSTPVRWRRDRFRSSPPRRASWRPVAERRWGAGRGSVGIKGVMRWGRVRDRIAGSSRSVSF